MMRVQDFRRSKRSRAIELRRKKFTYKEIIEQLHIAKSTLSNWINSDLSPVEERKIKMLTAKKGRDKIIKINKERSLKIQQKEKNQQAKYANQISGIDEEKLFWLGMGLYLAEGAKTDRWKAIFYNSDPMLNKIMVRFFRKICQVINKRIHVQLVLHNNVSEKKARKYWSRLLNIPKNNFYRASYIKSRASKGRRPKNRLPYGTVQLSISGKETANKIKGWMFGIKRKFAGVVQE